MSGGLAVIADVPKTTIYRLAEYLNKVKFKGVIPIDVIKKAPSAELRIGQKDSDSLPPYDVLDPILKFYVEQDKSRDYIISQDFDRKIVEDVIRMVDNNEYKRRQAAPSIKITPKAFVKDRRMPITNKYK